MIKKILVAVDGSDHARKALEYVCNMAECICVAVK